MITDYFVVYLFHVLSVTPETIRFAYWNSRLNLLSSPLSFLSHIIYYYNVLIYWFAGNIHQPSKMNPPCKLLSWYQKWCVYSFINVICGDLAMKVLLHACLVFGLQGFVLSLVTLSHVLPVGYTGDYPDTHNTCMFHPSLP